MKGEGHPGIAGALLVLMGVVMLSRTVYDGFTLLRLAINSAEVQASVINCEVRFSGRSNSTWIRLRYPVPDVGTREFESTTAMNCDRARAIVPSVLFVPNATDVALTRERYEDMPGWLIIFVIMGAGLVGGGGWMVKKAMRLPPGEVDDTVRDR
jgi:hypothetical protein